MTIALVAVLALVAGLAVGFAARKAIMARRLETAESRAAKLVADAELEAEGLVRQALVEVKQEISAMRKEAEEDVRLRREEIKKNEDRLTRREEQTDAKLQELSSKEQRLGGTENELERLREEVTQAATEQRRELERVSHLTAQEAKEALIGQVVDDAKRDAMATVREIEQQAREEGEKRARKIVTIAIQRVASEQTGNPPCRCSRFRPTT